MLYCVSIIPQGHYPGPSREVLTGEFRITGSNAILCFCLLSKILKRVQDARLKEFQIFPMGNIMWKKADSYTGIAIPMERWMAFSTSRRRKALIAPAKGPRIRKDLSRVVICSHFATEVSLSPPSPAGNSTWVGAGRRFVERGTTTTSLARRLRTSIETTRAGRSLVS